MHKQTNAMKTNLQNIIPYFSYWSFRYFVSLRKLSVSFVFVANSFSVL